LLRPAQYAVSNYTFLPPHLFFCCPQEFRRLDSQLGAARDRADLLAGSADTLPLLSVQVQSGTGALLRERATLNSSTNYVSGLKGWWC
jgi:hypothetical protein